MAQNKDDRTKDQKQRFIDAAHASGASMGKKEFSRVLGKIVKAKLRADKTGSRKP